MKKMFGKPIIFLAGLLLGAIIIGGSGFKNDPVVPSAIVKNGRVRHQWYPPKLPSEMTFAGERVPLQRPYVREMLEKQLLSNTFSHSHILAILQLSTRVFPEIEKILRQEGVPQDFKYMCVAESSLENAISPAGARGYWQFMKRTAKYYGLEVDREVDERYDLKKATMAACRYLKNAHQKFGNWTAAAASYNCGIGGYSRRASFQGYTNYYDLWLPAETNNYIYRILALKEIISHPQKYGFHLLPEDRYYQRPSTTITVTQSISNLADFARQHGTTYQMLHVLNPWLRSRSLTISRGNSYLIKLPK